MPSNVVDGIASGESPSDIAQQVKDILYAKAAERVDDYRKVAAANMFDVVSPYAGDNEVETEEEGDEE